MFYLVVLLFILLVCRNRSEAVDESLYLTNQDLTLRRTELLNLQEKHRDEMEKMKTKLESLKKNQSFVLNNLWEKVSCTYKRNIVRMSAFKVEELDLQTKGKDLEKSSDLLNHKQEDLSSLAKKIDLVEEIVGDRLKTNEGNSHGSNAVIE
jgi:hypothetical protein